VNRILVLGDGLLGSELVKQTGWDYISRKTGKKDLSSILESVIFRDENVIVNCIGNTDTYSNDKQSMMKVNYQFVVNLVNALSFSDKLVHISTDYVYSNSKQFAKETDVPVHNETWYGYSKMLADGYIENFSDNYLLCRMTHKPNPFPYKKAWKNQSGNFDYVDEQVKRLIKLIEVGAKGIVNVGGKKTSMYELALKTNPKVKPNECEHPVPNDVTMNTDKIKRMI